MCAQSIADGVRWLWVAGGLALLCGSARGDEPKGNGDPLRARLVADGYPEPQIKRDAESVEIVLPDPRDGKGAFHDPGESRLELARRLAERVRDVLGLPVPVLDKVETREEHPLDGAPNLHIVREVTFSQGQPPRNSECIDPMIVIAFGRDFMCSPANRCRWFPVRVSAACSREPRGPAPPSDASRRLPSTARGPLEYVAECERVAEAWGDRHEGFMIDGKGDLYAYSGGPALEDSPQTGDALYRKVRYGKRYLRTLPPDEVDAHAALIAEAARSELTVGDRGPADADWISHHVYVPAADGRHQKIVLRSSSPVNRQQRRGAAAQKLNAWLDRVCRKD